MSRRLDGPWTTPREWALLQRLQSCGTTREPGRDQFFCNAVAQVRAVDVFITMQESSPSRPK